MCRGELNDFCNVRKVTCVALRCMRCAHCVALGACTRFVAVNALRALRCA